MSKKPLILFVDDEPQSLKYFAKTVESSYEVLTALNANDARNLLNEHSKDIAVVISDQRMPTETGVQLLEYTRITHPRVVRLLTTAYSDLTSAIDAVNSGGIYWYVSKPWNAQELQSILKRATEYFYLQRDREQLMTTKANVFQHIILSDRIKSLILIANQLKSQGWARTNDSLNEYLIATRTAAALSWNINDTLAMDLREIAERECLFLIDVNESVHQLPHDKRQSLERCDLNQILSDVVADIIQSGEFEEIQFHLQSECHNIIESNQELLKILIKNVVARIANMDGMGLELFIEVHPSQNGTHVQVTFRPFERSWSSSQFAALFSAGVPSLNGLIGLDMDMLPSFLIAGHLSGRIVINAYPDQNAWIGVELPIAPQVNAETQSAKSLVKSAYDNLDNWIAQITEAVEV